MNLDKQLPSSFVRLNLPQTQTVKRYSYLVIIQVCSTNITVFSRMHVCRDVGTYS